MRKITDCRECSTPVLAKVDGVVVGKKEDKGWCETCMRKSVYLMQYLAKLALEDIEFSTVKKQLVERARSVGLDKHGGLTGDICPDCGNDMVEGSHVGACRKCHPEYFEECDTCGQEKICCICYMKCLI